MTVTVPWKIKRVYDYNATTETPFYMFLCAFFGDETRNQYRRMLYGMAEGGRRAAKILVTG